MPGYEPFLLCDFHVHIQWSDGRLTLRDTIDIYGRTGKFDVIAITDHVASSDFHKPKHLYSWKTLLRCDKQWPAIRKALCDNVDVALTLFRKESWTPGTAAAPLTGARVRPSVPLGRPAPA